MASYLCFLSSYTAGKKGGKISLTLDEDEAKLFEASLASFRGLPLKVSIRVDGEACKAAAALISDDQRKKIYVLIKAIADHMGEDANAAKNILKGHFCKVKECSAFSLSDCSKEKASSFLEFLIEFCLQQEVPINESIAHIAESPEAYQLMCIRQKKCCVCGRPGEIHHYDALGMGADRKTYDDTNNRKMCLCRLHHSEIHSSKLTKEEWCEQHHVVPVKE